jgi:hemerythrin
MTELVWDEDKHALGVAEMDATHQEFVDQALALERASDADFPALFAALVEHTHRHFDHESELMRRCRFPAIEEHEAEHRRILGEMYYLSRRVADGRLAMARAYVEGVPIWFANHLATMDAALAACLRRQD